MTSTLSLNEAAQRVGLSRWPVSRALQAGHLRGVRDNRGRWRVEAGDLDAWAAEHGSVELSTGAHGVRHGAQHGADGASTVLDRSSAPSTEVAELRLRLEAAELRATDLVHEREEARRERDRWRAMAERLVEREAERPAVPEPRRGLLARLLGRAIPKPGVQPQPQLQPAFPEEPQAAPVNLLQVRQDAPTEPEAPKEEPALLQVSERRKAVLRRQAEERAESERTGQPLPDRSIRPPPEILEPVERRRAKKAARLKPS